jgi:isopentenyl diphosphate isomerase/L-lactate dehydrogenase-like FMN-dependent dehydrogenase
MRKAYDSFDHSSLFALKKCCQAYGEAGVVKAVQILEREILTGMRLLGATNVNELIPEMVSRLATRNKIPC